MRERTPRRMSSDDEPRLKRLKTAGCDLLANWRRAHVNQLRDEANARGFGGQLEIIETRSQGPYEKILGGWDNAAGLVVAGESDKALQRIEKLVCNFPGCKSAETGIDCMATVKKELGVLVVDSGGADAAAQTEAENDPDYKFIIDDHGDNLSPWEGFCKFAASAKPGDDPPEAIYEYLEERRPLAEIERVARQLATRRPDLICRAIAKILWFLSHRAWQYSTKHSKQLPQIQGMILDRHVQVAQCRPKRSGRRYCKSG
jgi:hypothetical protein